MNRQPPFDHVDGSDVGDHESLRQSELVSRLTNRIEGDLCAGAIVTSVTISRAISQWLLDNDLRITPR